MNRVRNEELDYTTKFSVQVSGEGERIIHGFVVHFDIDFAADCVSPVSFSTGAGFAATVFPSSSLQERTRPTRTGCKLSFISPNLCLYA